MNIGETMTIKGREYTIRQKTVVSESLPNIHRKFPHLMWVLIVEGKRGALLSLYVSNTGNLTML